jgi:aspartyl protease family protein
MVWLLVILLAAVGGVLGLNALHPEALASQTAQVHLAYALALGAILISSLILTPRLRASETIKVGLTWAAVFLALIVIYRYQDGFKELGRQMVYAIDPSEPQSEGSSVILRASMGGHFLATAQVNGHRVRFLVDTGASEVVLTQDDAKRAGINIDDLAYTNPVETANGETYVAPVRLKSVKLNDIEIGGVDAAVARNGLDMSLLGMTFLRRLKSVEFSSQKLVLKN